MEKLRLSLLFASVLLLLVQVSDGYLTYRAAVVEYSPIFKNNETSRIEANLLHYENLIGQAKQRGAEIIVFPEGGLLIKTEYSVIPDPMDRIAPCDVKNYTKVLVNLSCASKNNLIYSVVNLPEKRKCAPDDENCPSKGYYIFNTNVVFDRNGIVIARYSKYNLFDEPSNDHTKDPEMVFFDTDFGVRFGTFICFDILFPTPAQKLIQQYRITDFVFTTFWFSELPFLTALQVQRGWAETNNVNLLASGVNSPVTGSGGSGIYNGKFGHIVEIMTGINNSKLLIADVPRIDNNFCSNNGQNEKCTVSEVVQQPALITTNTLSNDAEDTSNEDFSFLHDQMHLFSSEVIEEGRPFLKSVCTKNDFCCDFEVRMDSLNAESKNYMTRAVVVNGIRRFGKNFTGGIQSCGIVMCNGPNINSCSNRMQNITGLFKFKHIKILGYFKLKNSFQMPSTLAEDGKEIKPLPVEKYHFRKVEERDRVKVSLELVWPETNLQTFAIWGRDFTRDWEPLEVQSKASLIRHTSILLIPFVSFMLFFR